MLKARKFHHVTARSRHSPRSIYGGNSSSPASDVKVAPSIGVEYVAQIASIARQFGRNLRHLALDVSIDRGRTRQRGGAKSRVDLCVL